MPRRWLHESFDIVVWGDSYWQLHKRKDAAYKTLGLKHRVVGHPWYSRFKRDWTFEDPFPETVLARTRRIRITQGAAAAEKYQAALTHDYLDRLWDTFDRTDRIQVAESIRQLILNTKMLRDWAGVDVVRGLVKRVHGSEEGLLFPLDTWEPASRLARAYERLRTYVLNRNIDDLI